MALQGCSASDVPAVRRPTGKIGAATATSIINQFPHTQQSPTCPLPSFLLPFLRRPSCLANSVSAGCHAPCELLQPCAPVHEL